MAKMPKIHIQNGIVGLGLFAGEAVREGTNIIEYCGQRVPTEIFNKTITGDNDYAVDIPSENMIIDPTTNGNAARFVNHNCNPNAFLKEVGIGSQTIVVIRASRNINEDEEIFIRYGYNSLRTNHVLICECGSLNCKGVI